MAARLHTLTASAHRHHLDVWAYVDDVLRRLAGGDSDLSTMSNCQLLCFEYLN